MKSTIAIAAGAGALGLAVGLCSRSLLPTADAADLHPTGAVARGLAGAPGRAPEAAADPARVRTASADRGAERIDARAAPAAAGEPEPVEVPTDGSEGDLFAELTALLTSGRIEDHVAADGTSSKGYLFERYLDLRDADAAWGLLDVHGGTVAEWTRLGNDLNEQARKGDAARAWNEAVDLMIAECDAGSRSPWQLREIPNLLQRIRRVDAQLAARLAERHFQGDDLDDRLDLARYLAAAGRDGDVRALVDPLIEHPVDRVRALEVLAEIDPAEAESLLVAALAEGHDPALSTTLADLLLDQGRPDDALALADELMASGRPGATTLLVGVIDSLPRAVLVARMDDWVEQADLATLNDPAVELLSKAISLYSDDDRHGEAANLHVRLLESVASSGAPTGWIPTLGAGTARLYADRLVPALRNAEAGAGGDDEVWGDLADNYWRAGRHADAQRCWERARAIDPGDGEWSGKLRAVHDGDDPL